MRQRDDPANAQQMLSRYPWGNIPHPPGEIVAYPWGKTPQPLGKYWYPSLRFNLRVIYQENLRSRFSYRKNRRGFST